jgi:phosphoribosylformimino-5-aminoimidazole carboxamide ribotide isomerase
MEIIPAIDIINGKCVRLTEGDYARKQVYADDPLEMAKKFEGAGMRRLHLVDLDGARAGKVTNWPVLESIAANTALQVDFGGGIKTEQELQRVLDAGAWQATIGSLAVKNPEMLTAWVDAYGPEKFLLGADVKGEYIAISGWLETTDVSIYDFLAGWLEKGIRTVFCTDVAKDGKLEGPSVALYRTILEQFPSLPLIASGGVSSMDDLYALQETGCAAAIVGKAIYENRISLKELQQFIINTRGSE